MSTRSYHRDTLARLIEDPTVRSLTVWTDMARPSVDLHLRTKPGLPDFYARRWSCAVTAGEVDVATLLQFAGEQGGRATKGLPRPVDAVQVAADRS